MLAELLMRASMRAHYAERLILGSNEHAPDWVTCLHETCVRDREEIDRCETSSDAPGAPSGPYSTVRYRTLSEVPPPTMLRASPPSGAVVGGQRWACLACTERTRGGTVTHAPGEVCPNGGKP